MQEFWWTAEMQRLRGDLLLQRSPSTFEPAISAYNQAITRARSQQANTLWLRAAVSLAKLHIQQGNLADAQQLLSQTPGRLQVDSLEELQAAAELQRISRA